jgi:hypothetical protein
MQRLLYIGVFFEVGAYKFYQESFVVFYHLGFHGKSLCVMNCMINCW